MKEEVKIPSVGESIVEGMLTAWFKENGDFVKFDEDLYELETEKASITVPSPFEGILEIIVPEGTQVYIGQVVAMVDTSMAAPHKKKTAGPVSNKKITKPVIETKVETEKKMAKEAKKEIEPSGAGEMHADESLSKKVPMSYVRRAIAKRMLTASQEAAYLTTFNEIDMEKVIKIRKTHQEYFQKKYGVKLGFMSFFVKASVEALKAFPVINARIDGEDIVYYSFYDIGIAVSTDRGLLVPILRNADTLTFAELEDKIADLAERANSKKITLPELLGGTFTITNGGVFGSLMSTPIPNHPQPAILGMHAIQERPVAIKGEVKIKPMMYVALSYDHRLIDGKEAVSFLMRIKEYIEDPEEMFLNI